ncbi:MAG: hypothetical protein ACR2G0_01390 [Chthoniobacterales bacterium]
MAQKKDIKVKDLKPTKDAKGGAARSSNASTNRAAQGAGRSAANRSSNSSTNRSAAGRTTL